MNLLSCVSMNNGECKVRLQIVSVNGDDPVFFPFGVKTSKCSGSCSNIINPCAKLCVVKNLNVKKVFSLVSEINETRDIEWHETCKYKCRFNSSVCNNKQRWMMINAGANANHWLIKVYEIKVLFWILVIVSVNVINPMILVSI